MQARRILKVARGLLGAVWVALVVFLALAFPAHAVLSSERGALSVQLCGAFAAAGLFASRRRIVRDFVTARAGDEDGGEVLPRVPEAIASPLVDPQPAATAAIVGGLWARLGRDRATRRALAAAEARRRTGSRAPASVPQRASQTSPPSTP